MRQIATAMPHAKLFGTSAVALPGFADPVLGGIPLALDSRLLLTLPPVGPDAVPAAGRSVLGAYARRYGDPSPWSLYGYEAMSLMLAAIAKTTEHGEDPARRSKIVQALLRTRDHTGAIGTYSIARDGDTSMRGYGVYRIVDGQLRYWTVFVG
jgi:ABC-type branched-subunit amino acid transport system substrate-binding protein